jgi:PAS domain S-box-containing protein
MGIDQDKNLLKTPAELRNHAEAELRARPAHLPPLRPEVAPKRLAHELEIHQVELEAQNAELLRAQEALELSRSKYTGLYDFAPIGYFSFDAAGLILEVNITGSQLLGMERGFLAGKPLAEFIADPESGEVFDRHLANVLSNQGMQKCGIRLRGKGGAVIQGQLQSVAVGSSEGSWSILSSIVDGTAAKLLELETQDAREYAESIVEAVREPLVVLDSKLKILTANNSFYDTFKVTPEETIGYFIYDLGNRQWDIPKLRALFEDVLPGNIVFNDYEVEHDFLGIGKKTILLNARQISRKNIGSHIILLAMEDITERKKLAADLQQAHDRLESLVDKRTAELRGLEVQQHELGETNRRLDEVSRTKSDFLANMSHELRTPLNSVIGFSEVLQDQLFGALNGKQQEYVQNILASGKHLLSLINDILDLSKVESGKMELDLTEFSLLESLAASLTMLREKAMKSGIELKMELTPENDVSIEADQRKLKQIMFNLVSNAVKFSRPGGTVTVAAVRDGDLMEITVEDTGIGIKKEDIPKLFQEFTQLESVYTKEIEGTGLGLALTRHMVELHGGRVWVKSEIGVGSRFSFTIPLTHAGAKEPPIERLDCAGSGNTVLVIDDNPLTLDSMENALRFKGYQALRADNGNLGIEMAQRDLPDLIVLDLVMPGTNGFDVAERLLDENAAARVPILVLTSMDLTAEDRARLYGKVWRIEGKGTLSTHEFLDLVESAVGPADGS